MSVPQVIVTIHPETGDLVVELPGFMATRRTITLREADAGASLKRILAAQASNRAEIGLDGAPTQRQVQHWERHATWPSASCRFCVAEGRASFAVPRTPRPQVISTGEDGTVVRKLKAGQSFKHKTLETKRDAKELGL